MQPNKPIKTPAKIFNSHHIGGNACPHVMIGFNFPSCSKPNADRRVILLDEAIICSHVNGLLSFVRKYRKRWLAQVSSGGRVNVLPQSFLHIDKSELKQRGFWVTQVNRKWASSFLDGSVAQIFGQIVSVIVKTIRNTNLVASTCFKIKRPHFRLTRVAQKRLCLSSLMTLRAYIIVWLCKLWPEPELNVLVT